MVTFEKHILNILNDWLHRSNLYGEFYFIKSNRRGTFNIIKIITIELHFKTPFEDEVLLTHKGTHTLQEADIQEGYDKVFEEILYMLIIDKEIWNSINTKLL